MANTILIANSLSIAESLILESQEWAQVFWVKLKAGSPRFVSKKIQLLAIAARYAYCSDGGHSIVCCLKQDFQTGIDLTDFLLPVPVKSVLRGYQNLDGYIVVDLPYSTEIGLITSPEDDEF